MNEFCITHNSHFQGDACVFFATHPEEVETCEAGVDPDYDSYWES